MRVVLLGDFGGAAAHGLRAAGHAVEVDAAEGPVTGAAEGADVVVTILPDDRAARRVYTELARTASPGQVFVDLGAGAATHEWCALVLPAFVGVRGAVATGEPGHVERARPVLQVLAANR